MDPVIIGEKLNEADAADILAQYFNEALEDLEANSHSGFRAFALILIIIAFAYLAIGIFRRRISAFKPTQKDPNFNFQAFV